MEITLNNKNKRVSGIIEVPADKSITHRAVMLSSLASGVSSVKNYLPSDDCLRTVEAFRQMGAEIKEDGPDLYIKGCGLKLRRPQSGRIYAGNSGTTARLLSGILAGQSFDCVIEGDPSLSKRPMQRVIDPLSRMGAVINSDNGLLPLLIKGTQSPLKSAVYSSSKSSAQVKSAVLLAGLYADGATVYEEPIKSRDHSERMLSSYGAKIEVNGNSVTVYPAQKLYPRQTRVPGDISSAAFFIAAALITPGSDITIKNVNVNPTRDGLIDVLLKMGAQISLDNLNETSGEPVADINVKYSELKAAEIDSSIMPRMIDEIPIFALISTRARGVTKITGAGELRVKESDRLAAITSQFLKIGAEIEELEDGLIINGSPDFRAASSKVDSFEDHRIAMTLAVASLIAAGDITIKNADCVNISFPGFYEVLKSVCA
jgi:3-phosphoshikimate 1-carboxyvinyltransferase